MAYLNQIHEAELYQTLVKEATAVLSHITQNGECIHPIVGMFFP